MNITLVIAYSFYLDIYLKCILWFADFAHWWLSHSFCGSPLSFLKLYSGGGQRIIRNSLIGKVRAENGQKTPSQISFWSIFRYIQFVFHQQKKFLFGESSKHKINLSLDPDPVFSVKTTKDGKALLIQFSVQPRKLIWLSYTLWENLPLKTSTYRLVCTVQLCQNPDCKLYSVIQCMLHIVMNNNS